MLGRIPLVDWVRARYAGLVPIRRRPESNVAVVKRLSKLDSYEGQWVGVKGGDVIARAATSGELALELRRMGEVGRGAVMQFVQPEADAFIVGVG